MLHYLQQPDAANEIAGVSKIACEESEPRFVRGFAWHRTGASPKSSKSPAAILHDTNDVPFAYLKASGKPVAYCAQDGTLKTKAGLRHFTANSLFVLDWGGITHEDLYNMSDDNYVGEDKNDIRHAYRGLGLVAIHRTQPNDAYFVRMASATLPRRLRPYLGSAAADRQPKLADNQAAACRLTAATVQHAIAELLPLARCIDE